MSEPAVSTGIPPSGRLDPSRLTALLAGIVGEATVTEVAVEPIGTGQMADCLRCYLSYDRTGPGPASLVVKLPSSDPKSVETAVALRSYEIEVSFYRHLSSSLSVRTPVCYHADLAPGGADFLLILEDVAPCRQGDQLAGCSPDEADLAVAELPGLHAPRWGDDKLGDLDWLHRNGPATVGVLPALVRGLYPGFVERYHDRVQPDVLALAERLMASLDLFDAHKPGPWTVTHGDFRLDNLLFPPPEAGRRVAVVDWQTASFGPGASDLSYFLGASLEPEARRAHETDLVRSYHGRLVAAGVELAWETLWRDYRRYSLGGLIMAIAASMLVKRTERGDDMFVTMANRHGTHATDLEALQLLK